MKRLSSSDRILLLFFIVFLALGIYSLLKGELLAIDKFTTVAFLGVFLLINRKVQVNPIIAFLAGLIFVPHHIGSAGLYGLAALNYHYDWIVHIVAAFLSTIVIMYVILNNFSKKFFVAAIIALSITVSIGAALESLEYWGFLFFGFGEGYLGFGAGDNSQNFGPWENSSLDSTLNIAASMLAILFFYVLAVYKKQLGNHKTR